MNRGLTADLRGSGPGRHHDDRGPATSQWPDGREPTPGTLSPRGSSVLEDSLRHFEADLNDGDPVHRQAAQLANLCIQAVSEYASLMAEADAHLAKADRDRIIPAHQTRALEGLSRLTEILGIDSTG
ncbi:hypothetical protein [Streptomyces sp. NPDC051657]|uniref:hypothetical protein n=1 Tax=unclassified Streptomyces TaxID=2593676 RepID=UPI0034283E98